MVDTWHIKSKVFQQKELDLQLSLHILFFLLGLQVIVCNFQKHMDDTSSCLYFLCSLLHSVCIILIQIGMPGLKASLLEEFGVRFLTYDLPGFGESDPHPSRNLESSASDMSILADALGIEGKFWVVGYSSGSMHAWAALRYIPDRLAGTLLPSSPFLLCLILS